MKDMQLNDCGVVVFLQNLNEKDILHNLPATVLTANWNLSNKIQFKKNTLYL